MKIYGVYFAKKEFYQKIKEVGGEWNDTKERPVVCLFKIDNSDIYWAIPMGNFNHRDEKAKRRLKNFLECDKKDIRSCFYHIGKTTVESIFFISDVIPIIDKYIEKKYLIYNSEHYIIKNRKLIEELERKLRRILFYESINPNFFRQHITDIKNKLIEEIDKI
ncbi:hypothetical protein [Pseudoleptotrichia goodfellowii]|uniref:Uncharacterized protein n=1 Tax=Pseudoleptotrichia goodfellowii F0264 TaxID=596323 RepID=D0GIZ1_9FUSO|nr:hypothetical protein [Pseudoleptotrichia goodfellowii]EEY35930.1 hypothetical protein HMPREF0554_1263 [Pseudoleptotrichia goodfellowii F0264]MBF4805198.1 hypothetical protein [Pseudoleptotrichia goodfellowii]